MTGTNKNQIKMEKTIVKSIHSSLRSESKMYGVIQKNIKNKNI